MVEVMKFKKYHFEACTRSIRMNLNFSDEQQMLRDQVQKFCESDYTFNKREEILKSDLGYDADLWKLFSELGWLSLPFAEENGGFGYGPIEPR